MAHKYLAHKSILPIVKEIFCKITMKELNENLAKINDKPEFQQLFLLFVVSVMLRPTKQYVLDKRFYGVASIT